MRVHIAAVIGFVVVVVALVGVGCAAPPPSANPSPSEAANRPPEAFDFTGTTWRAELINGVPVAAAQAPTLVIDAFGRDSAGGWTGCEDYGVGMSFEGGNVTVGDFVGNTGTCDGATAQLEGAYIQMLRGAAAYRLDGDVLVLISDLGDIAMRRTVPAADAPARPVLDAMRASDWDIERGTGLHLPGAVSPIRFSDDSVFGIGGCGFSGRYTLGPDGPIAIDEVGYDAMSCGTAEADAARDVVVRLLQSAAVIELDGGGGLEIRGPVGELRLVPSEP